MGFANVGNPQGKSSVKKSADVTNPFPGRKNMDSMTGNSKPSQKSQTAYAGKSAAASSGFATSRARELGKFKK